MKKSIVILCLVFIAFGCKISKNTINSTTEISESETFSETITSNELKDLLYDFASDEFNGRETGTEGQKKAVNYLKDYYTSLGVPSPLPNGSYFQEVPLEFKYIPKADISVNGENYLALDYVLTNTFTASTTLMENEIVYAGYGIDDPKYSDYTDLNVADKFVLVKAGEPKNNDGTYVTSGTKAATQWTDREKQIQLKTKAALLKKAKGLLLYDDRVFKQYSEYFKNRDRNTPKMTLVNTTEADNPFLFCMISKQLAKAIYPDIEKNQTPQTIKKPFSIKYTNNTKPVISENVLGYIKGSEKPEEIVVISAHLDHLGSSKGEIYNGADDDGSGTVAILEIAEAFKTAVDKGFSPKRSVLFIHFTGEEKGLFGSKYYTDSNPVFPLENTIANLNIDMIGRVDSKHKTNDNYLYLIGSDRLSTQLHQISETVNSKYTKINLDYTYNDENDPNRFYYRSDHYNFAKNNIPVIFYFNGTHDDYHKPSDTPDKIRYDLLEKRTKLVFYTAWELANRKERVIVDKTN